MKQYPAVKEFITTLSAAAKVVEHGITRDVATTARIVTARLTVDQEKKRREVVHNGQLVKDVRSKTVGVIG